MKSDNTEATTIYQTIQEELERLRLTSRAKLRRELKRLQNDATPGKLAAFLEKVRACAKSDPPLDPGKLDLSLNDKLPIFAMREELTKAFNTCQVVIVCGETGSGKTTQLPKIALANNCGRFARIGCTQPRRIAASSLARQLAKEVKCQVGNEVGYQVRFDDQTGKDTMVKFMTDGILLAETATDPLLNQYDCLILDEVHERTLNIDFLLGYCKSILPKRPDLHLMISSATMDSGRISEFFDNAPVVNIAGKSYPVEDYYLRHDDEEELPESVWHGVEFADSLDRDGDILVFLPGEREIRESLDYLSGKKLPDTEILPLFGRLSASGQQKIFSPGRKRRIILATNVAETSVTIPKIKFVVDSGLVRLSRYNPRRQVQELLVENISLASVRQRRGRCGRISAGVCIHLYSEDEQAAFAEYTPPEIQRSSLAGVILKMAALKLPPLENFPLVDPPPIGAVREGRALLGDLLALDPQGKLTPEGKSLAVIPLDPVFGKMILSGSKYHVLPELINIAAFLSIQDLRERPFEEEKAADSAHKKFECETSDYLTILNIAREIESHHASNSLLRKFCTANYLNFRRTREFCNLVDDLQEVCRKIGVAKLDNFRIDWENLAPDAIHKAVLCAIPRHIGVFDVEKHLYRDMRGKLASIFPGSALSRAKKLPPEIIFFALVETSRLYARNVAGINLEFLEEVAPHVCRKSYEAPVFDADSGFVYAKEKVSLGQIVISEGRRCHYGNIDPRHAKAIYIRDGILTRRAVVPGVAYLEKFYREYQEIEYREIKLRHLDSLLDRERIFDCFFESLPDEVNNNRALALDWKRNKINHAPQLLDMLSTENPELPDERDYPDFLAFGGRNFALHYRFSPGEDDDGITLDLPKSDIEVLDNSVIDFLVPGFLAEKVRFCIHSLPRSLRKNLTPIQETVDDFMRAFRNGEIFTGQTFAEALCNYCNEFYDSQLTPDLIENMALPEFLRMKVAIISNSGKIINVVRELPKTAASSRINRHIPEAGKFFVSGCESWAGNGTMPEKVPVSKSGNTMGFVAQTFDGTHFGRSVFLHQKEALRSHRQAVIALYRKHSPQLFKYLRNSLKVGNEEKITFFLNYVQYQDDISDYAAEIALGGNLWSIRSESVFRAAAKKADGELVAAANGILEQLSAFYASYEKISSIMHKMRHASEIKAEIRSDLDVIFRPGFFRTPELFERTARWLRAMNLRLERALAFPGRDMEKGRDVAPYSECFHETLANGAELAPYSDLADFFLLLMEAKISIYAPEMKPLEKCSIPILAERWEKVEV